MLGRMAVATAGIAGGLGGLIWSLALGTAPASSCPVPGEARVQCLVQQVWLAGLTRVVLCAAAAMLLVRGLQAAPGWLRARREGRLGNVGTGTTPDDEVLVAASWGYRHVPDGRTVVRRATRLRWDREASAPGRRAEPCIEETRRLLADIG